jgi:tetrahydromethanopterin S-methyltransferase subunit G
MTPKACATYDCLARKSFRRPHNDRFVERIVANDEYNQLRQELEFVDEKDKSNVYQKLGEYKQIGLRLQKIVVP